MSEGAFYDVRDVKAATNGRWAGVLAGFGANAALLRNHHGPCPGCGGKDRFRFDDVGGDGSFLCSQGGGEVLAGDGFSLLMHIKGWEWKRCVAEIGMALNVTPRAGARSSVPSENWNAGVAEAPTSGEAKKRPELDEYQVWEFTRGCPEIDEAWLARRSPIPVDEPQPLTFLRHLYREDEKVLIFTQEFSQGEFLAWVRPGELMPDPSTALGMTVQTYRLAKQKGVRAVESALPSGGPKGVWFLTNPVTGQWAINPRAKNRDNEHEPKWSRRSEEMITSFRHFVLESDELTSEQWLKVLANLRLPICAIYTSGKRSIHALVQCEVPTKAHWDATRDVIRQLVCPLGADPGALSAVRLSRLPGCQRGKSGPDGRDGRQTLLYLNPSPDGVPLRLLPEQRS